MGRRHLLIMTAMMAACTAVMAAETLPPVKAGKAPQTFEEMWAGFDPRKEPLEVEVLKEWERDGVALKVLRYRTGLFKGKKATMAAVYGYPKGRRDLPGLVQIHGGGQFADHKACFANAKRGYATLSIAWAGRINAPGYTVKKTGVQLFWDGKIDDRNYRVTTDWGALDAYHAPCRNLKNNFANVKPHPWTVDAVDSPRNNPWFLVALGARRALTFLEQQPEVDKNRLGVYGHSMGGKLTVLTTAADARVKAAAPSCGGISNRNTPDALYNATIADDVNLKQISCPIVFLSPANDFHGAIDDLQKSVKEIKAKAWRVTCAPHHNHQDTAAYEVATQLWFDQVFKKSFEWPKTPESKLILKTKDGVPAFTVTPHTSGKILSVDVFYTHHGLSGRTDMENTKNRFWHHADAMKSGGTWAAQLPILNTDKPLWVYANVLYALDEPVTGAGYYYGTYTTGEFNVSSLMSMATPEQIKEAGAKATRKPTPVIEDFQGDWRKEWFVYSNDPENWQRKTHKVYDDVYKAPVSARLALEVRTVQPNKLLIGLDKSAAEVELKGGTQWQKLVLSPSDFKDAEGKKRMDWRGIKELRLGHEERLRPKAGKPVKLGGAWKGAPPAFRKLHWLSQNQTTR